MASSIRSAFSRVGNTVFHSSNAAWQPTKAFLLNFEQTSQHVVKPATRETSNTLFAQWISTTLASIPSRVETVAGEIKALQSGLTSTVTVAEAAVAGLYLAELYAWFKVGECVGRGSTNGYKI